MFDTGKTRRRAKGSSIKAACLGSAAALVLSACSTLGISEPAVPASPDTQEPLKPVADAAADPVSEARALHESLLVMDTHLDTPANFANPAFSLIGEQAFAKDGTQIDLPRMHEGGLDGGFWVIFTAQGPLTIKGYQDARDAALIRAGEIREAAARHHAHFELAFDSADAARINASGKRVMYQSIENSYPLGGDVTLLDTFYKFGVRMVGPVHFANNQFADSATDPVGQRWDGLSPLGRELVRRANALGVVLDGSHAHDEAVYEMISLSTTPLILSHTGVKAIYDHPRNIDDALLTRLAETGGVIQINAYSGYLEELVDTPERIAALDALNLKFGGEPGALEGEALAQYIAARRDLDRVYPPNRSSFEKFAEHLLHALDLVGPDHVGIGADWDGGGGVGGMEDIASIPRITELLIEEGYSEEDIAKIWSGNMLRVLKAAEDAATIEMSSLPTVR